MVASYLPERLDALWTSSSGSSLYESPHSPTRSSLKMSDTSSMNSYIFGCWIASIQKAIVTAAVVLGVAFSWTAAAQFSQRTLRVDPSHFNAPYFSMWFGTNFMILCYPVYLIYELLVHRKTKKMAGVHREACRVFGERGLTAGNLLLYVTPFNLFWISANYTFSRALMFIAASVVTAISSCNAAMVYILAIIFLRESLLTTKTMSVVLSMSGVIVMSIDLPQSDENKTPWLGVLLSIASAFSAAVYKVAFKKIIKSPNLGQVSLFMTCLGFLNLTLNAIPTAILLLTKVEHIDWGFIPWGYMCASAVLSLFFNFLLNFGVALLSPLVPSIGMLVGIPINTACDVIFNNVSVNTLFIVGTVLIGLSFFLIIIPLDDWEYNQIYMRTERRARSETGKVSSYQTSL